MNKRIFRIASLLLVTTLLISVFAVGSFALEWDGDSVGGGGNGTDAGKVGYAIRTLGDNVIGYRFSLVDIYGNNKVSKVIDVFQDRYHGDNGYNSLYKFVPKCNKRQLIDSQDGAFTTENNKINCYKEADMGFATALPSPDGMGEWQNNMERLKEKLYDGTVTRSDITRITRRLGDAIGKVYGWSFPSPGRSQDLSR